MTTALAFGWSRPVEMTTETGAIFLEALDKLPSVGTEPIVTGYARLNESCHGRLDENFTPRARVFFVPSEQGNVFVDAYEKRVLPTCCAIRVPQRATHKGHAEVKIWRGPTRPKGTLPPAHWVEAAKQVLSQGKAPHVVYLWAWMSPNTTWDHVIFAKLTVRYRGSWRAYDPRWDQTARAQAEPEAIGFGQAFRNFLGSSRSRRPAIIEGCYALLTPQEFGDVGDIDLYLGGLFAANAG